MTLLRAPRLQEDGRLLSARSAFITYAWIHRSGVAIGCCEGGLKHAMSLSMQRSRAKPVATRFEDPNPVSLAGLAPVNARPSPLARGTGSRLIWARRWAGARMPG